MKALFAIVKLTLRNAIRSHVFQLLLLFLLLCVGLVPTTVGGGTATDFIRVSLLYSLSGVGTILSLSALWVGCQVMTADIDSYQLHMVVAKPVSRVTIWFGKYLGVLILHLVLLAIAAAAIYGVVLWRFRNSDFPRAERDRIESEVLVGRRVFMPYASTTTESWGEHADYETRALKRRDEKLKNATRPNTSKAAQDRLYKECLKEVIAEDSEVAPALEEVKLNDGRTAYRISESKYRTWVYKDVPRNVERLLYLRYRPYVGKVKSDSQRNTRVWWFIRAPAPKKPAPDGAANAEDPENSPRYWHPVPPAEVMAGEFHEIRLLGDKGIVSPEGNVEIRVLNLDDKLDKQFYQPGDGPMLMVEITGFLGNYSRAILVMALQLAMMAAISCALGGSLTLPTAVFVSMSYLLFGFMATFMTDPDYYVNGAMDQAGQWMSWRILDVVVPLERFDVTDLIADGKLVEWSLIWNITWSCLLLRTLPLVLIGIYFYRRREIGLVIRK